MNPAIRILLLDSFNEGANWPPPGQFILIDEQQVYELQDESDFYLLISE